MLQRCSLLFAEIFCLVQYSFVILAARRPCEAKQSPLVSKGWEDSKTHRFLEILGAFSAEASKTHENHSKELDIKFLCFQILSCLCPSVILLDRLDALRGSLGSLEIGADVGIGAGADEAGMGVGVELVTEVCLSLEVNGCNSHFGKLVDVDKCDFSPILS